MNTNDFGLLSALPSEKPRNSHLSDKQLISKELLWFVFVGDEMIIDLFDRRNAVKKLIV